MSKGKKRSSQRAKLKHSGALLLGGPPQEYDLDSLQEDQQIEP